MAHWYPHPDPDGPRDAFAGELYIRDLRSARMKAAALALPRFVWRCVRRFGASRHLPV